MLQAGLVLVTLGILGLIYGIFMKLRAGRVSDAPLVKTGDAASRGDQVASPKGAISVEGDVRCDQPLIAPFSGQPCLAYELKATAEWKDGETNKTKEVAHEKVAAQFTIDDGSGPVPVDARELGDFEPWTSKSETKGLSLVGGITGQTLAFGSYQVQVGALAMGTKIRVQENVLPVVPRLYACGKTNAGRIGAPGWRQLLLTERSRDQYLGAAMQHAKIGLGAGGGAFVLGAILATIAQVMSGGSQPVSDQKAAATQASPAKAPPAAPPAAKKK